MEEQRIERGARLFAYESRGRTLKPQQYEVGAALDRLEAVTAITMSRRSAKTESVLLWVFAMMQERPGLKVAFTMATTREAARAKFLADVLPVMEDLAEASDEVHLLKGAGYERVDLGTSFFQVLAFTDKAFRSKEFDILIIDEGGEADPDVRENVLPAALPTLDTSELGMTVIMGTAGDYREGNLLWDALHDEDAAVVDYSLGDDIDTERMSDWDYVSSLLGHHHPGVGTLTTLARLKSRWAALSHEKFAREYLGVWGSAAGAGGEFKADKWHALDLHASSFPTPPRRFALAVAATDAAAAIVAVWREDGEARVLVLDAREGRAWLPVAARDLARKYRVPVVVDPAASQVMQDVKQALEQLRPAARLAVQTYEDVGAAHERFTQEIGKGTIRHYGQAELTEAVLAVKRTQMGAKWKWGRVQEDADITPAQAATLALRYFDAMPRAVTGTAQAVAV